MPNFTFCGGRELKTTTFFLISRTSIQSYFEFNSRKICQIEQDGISASHIFKSDVFVAVAAVVAYKLPTFYRSLFTRARVFKSLFIGFFSPSSLGFGPHDFNSREIHSHFTF